MESTNLNSAVYSVVALVVIVILIATVCIPVIEDAQKEQVTDYNNESVAYRIADTTENITVTLYDSYITVNDLSIDKTDKSTSILRCDNINLTLSGGVFWFKDLSEPVNRSVTVNGSTVVISGNTWTIGEDTGSVIGTLYVISDEGSIGEYYPSSETPVYINDNSVLSFMLSGVLTAEGMESVFYSAIMRGTIGNLQIISMYVGETPLVNPTATVTLSADSYTAIDPICYALTGINGTITYTDSDVTYSGSLSTANIFAPIAYQALSDNDSMIYSLLGVIPLMLLMIPIMVCVGIFTRRD